MWSVVALWRTGELHAQHCFAPLRNCITHLASNVPAPSCSGIRGGLLGDSADRVVRPGHQRRRREDQPLLRPLRTTGIYPAPAGRCPCCMLAEPGNATGNNTVSNLCKHSSFIVTWVISALHVYPSSRANACILGLCDEGWGRQPGEFSSGCSPWVSETQVRLLYPS